MWGDFNQLTGHSSLEKVLMQASSLASQTETRASAEPVAKYLPHLAQTFNWNRVMTQMSLDKLLNAHPPSQVSPIYEPAELNADAVPRVCLQYMLNFQFWPGQDLKGATCIWSFQFRSITSMQPWPLVRKKRSLAMFHEISFTSNLNCLSAFTLYVLLSIKVTRSSLFPTAIVCPSGLQVMLMFCLCGRGV